MFDAINGPNNQYEGPAVGQTTEKGDSWHTAVGKINGMFKHLFSAVENGIEQVDKDARKAICDLEETVADLQQKYDELFKIATAVPMPAAPLDMGSDTEIVAQINAAANVASTPISTDPAKPSFTHEPLAGFGVAPALAAPPDAPVPAAPAPDTAPSSLP